MKTGVRSKLGLAVRSFAAVAAAVAMSGVLVLPTSAATASVSMTEPQENQYAFTPGSITVAVGDRVSWTNKTDAPHTVTSDGGGPLNSATEQQNQTFSFTFTTPGTFAYHCSVHPYMHGTVVVNATSSPSSSPAPASSPPAPAASPASQTASGRGATPSPVQVPQNMPRTGDGGQASSNANLNWTWLTLVVVITSALAMWGRSRVRRPR